MVKDGEHSLKNAKYMVCGNARKDYRTYLRLNDHSERGSCRLDADCRRGEWSCQV